MARLEPRRPTSRASSPPGVDASVKNAALKKLFADPHFNVMDGLDTYIDDYGKPDPIPEAHAAPDGAVEGRCGLFDDEDQTTSRRAAAPWPGATPDGAGRRRRGTVLPEPPTRYR